MPQPHSSSRPVPPRTSGTRAILRACVALVVLVAGLGLGLMLLPQRSGAARSGVEDQILAHVFTTLGEGRQTFRFDTFGSEAFWGGQLGLHNAIKGAGFPGGVGPGLSPRMALGLGLKVDADALPRPLVAQLKQGKVNLNDPAITLALLRLNAVVGLTGFFGQTGLTAVGIQCALCHSIVNNSLAPGIGERLDGWANRDLDIGQIIALSPNLQPFITLLRVVHPTIDDPQVREVLRSWGPGKFDAELILDGKTMNPNTEASAATLIPPAFGLAGVNLHTWTGWGSVPHWNAFVANLEMHGSGTFYDPRLNDAARFPIAAFFGFGNVRSTPDLITPKLAALHLYQLAIPAPKPPAGTFDPAAAALGEALFAGKARCATCHVPPLFTEPGWNLHTPAEVGIDDFQAQRAPDQRYRTAPLKGLWTHGKGGYYHDGRFATLQAVVGHYNTVFGLELTEQEANSLIEYLKSL
jgi:mono/diheme cytochrome c family protein